MDTQGADGGSEPPSATQIGSANPEIASATNDSSSDTKPSIQMNPNEDQIHDAPSPVPQPIKELDAHPNDAITTARSNPPAIVESESKVVSDKKKEDDKLAIYKALAIKLKKELVKSRDELLRLREDSQKECNELRDRVKSLEQTLDLERQDHANINLTLEAKVRSLKQQLESSETDLQSLQTDFENYKVKACEIMKQTNTVHPNSNRTFEEDRYKQLKELNDEQVKRINNLELQLSSCLEKNKELEKESRLYQDHLRLSQERIETLITTTNKYETLSRENENLKLAIKQYRTKLKEPNSESNSEISCGKIRGNELDTNTSSIIGTGDSRTSDGNDTCSKEHPKTSEIILESMATSKFENIKLAESPISTGEGVEDTLVSARISPSASIKGESQTNSSSSFDGSTSGYVHIKPATFEFISRSSVLEDAQNQIDNLTKAYLDSENTNSLLSEQVKALKEEIRRMQRGTERLDLAENLEYLKNVVFKFLSLESGQTEQRQRLVPVLSTVLKLSPDETSKLVSLAAAEKPSMASSFFKL